MDILLNQPFLKTKLKSFVDIKRDEVRQTFLMFAYNFLVIASHTIVKSLRDALFIHQSGAEKLPYVYIGLALIAGIIMQGYSRIAQVSSRRQLIIGSNLFFVSNILAFWWLFHYEWQWLSYMLYIWASIFSAISTVQFWLVANDIFNPRQARRLFGFIISGGTLGGILAGGVARGIVNIVNTENLLFGVAALLLVCVPIIRQVTHPKPGGLTQDTNGAKSTQRATQDIGGAFTLIRKNKHLTLLTAIIGVTIIATTLVDFQFKIIVERAYKEKDALMGFFGSYYAYINIVTILLQLLVTGQVLKRFGVGVAILIMPIGLFLGSFAILFYPVLWAAVFVKTCDDSFSFSVNKSGIEVLYIPVPAAVKDKTKAFIDIVVERASRGIGGALLLLLTAVLSLNINQLSIFVLIFLGIWIFVSTRIKKEYIASVEATLKKHSLNVDALTTNLDSSTVSQLLPILDSQNERQILYALELLHNVKSSLLVQRLQPLLHHPSPQVKVKTLQLLFDNEARHFTPQVEALLEDEDEDVQAEAMHYVCFYSGEPLVQKIRSFLAHPDYRMKGAAITCIINHGGDEECSLLARDLIEQMLQETGTHRTLARLEAAKALGAIDANSPLQDYLLDLLNDDNIDVVKEAIISAGRVRRIDFVPLLIEKLGDSTTRVLAREALANYGPEILVTLIHTVTDEQALMSVCRHIPRVFGLIKHQDSVDVLLSNLNQDEIEFRYKMIKALGKLRASQVSMEAQCAVHLQFDSEKVESYLVVELKNYYNLLMIYESITTSLDTRTQDENYSSLLRQALQERLEQLKEMIFRLLGLIYPPDSMRNAYRGVTSPNLRIRANAVELLDSILKRDVKRMLFPIIDESQHEAVIQRAFALWNLHPITKEEGIVALITGKDTWLKACAFYLVAEEEMLALAEYIEDELESSNPLIRESAELAWRKLRHK
ncbi:HEAT repeat domain-containing protein [bacterium]|nr:HEAT repeat domain-containing protein [bacterium]